MGEQRSNDDRIAVAVANSAYPPEAFYLVLDCALAALRDRLLLLSSLESGHITAEQLCNKVCAVATFEFGDDAESRLNEWNIRTTRDLGEIVFALVEVGLLRTAASDSTDDFDNLFPLRDALASASQGGTRTARRSQYSLATLLLITTIAAFAAAGYGRLGLAGTFLSLCLAWWSAIAIACLWIAFQDRRAKPWPALLLGSLFLGLVILFFIRLFVHQPFSL